MSDTPIYDELLTAQQAGQPLHERPWDGQEPTWPGDEPVPAREEVSGG